MKYAFGWLIPVFLLSGCHKAPPVENLPRTVELVQVGLHQDADQVQLAGQVKAQHEANLGFQVSGRVIRRDVQLGDRVHAGEVLASLDARDLDLAVIEARAALAAARSDRELARTDLKRATDLQQGGYLSTAERDHRREAVDAADARFQQAEADLAIRLNQQSYAVLKSPVNGIITALHADIGQIVAAGESVFQVTADGQRDIEVVIPEDRLPMLHHSRAFATLWADPGHELAAQLREVSAAADPITRTFTVRYALTHAPADLALGQSAVLHLRPEHPQTQLLIPTTALFQQDNQSRVWVFNPIKQIVTARAVQIVGISANDIAVAGLNPGEQIVAQGVHVLTDGEHVQPDFNAR